MKLIMAALDDLILQIKDPELRERIQKEADSLLKQKKFGLVFEDHLPTDEIDHIFDQYGVFEEQ